MSVVPPPKSAGAALLRRSQERGAARTDIDGIDLFALMGAIGWIENQPAFASVGDYFAGLIAGALAPPSLPNIER